MEIPDPRLGYRNEEGVIEQWPQRWATGVAFSAKNNRDATQFWLTDRWFVVLPINIGRLPGFVETELRKKIAPPTPKKPAKTEIPVEPVNESEVDAN